jgi:hypothetical protein
MTTALKITKTAVRTLAREVGAQVWHKDPDRRYETHMFGRPSLLWVTRSIVEQHEAIMADIASHGVVGNANRHFGYDDRGFGIGNRYGAAKPKIADLNRAKATGDLQTLADIMAWWSAQMAPRVEVLKAQGRW